ncbi:uncharacterized protein [Miscanthus floridulus]|uniref:uncharacterized protein n=1 Tax=Miscanthus floridulus TaxID=154761 RepID=UPI003457FFB6
MAAAATRARGGPRRPFAPVVVAPPPLPSQAENRLAHEDAPSSFARREPRRFGACAGKVAGPAVLGAGGKASKKCGPGSSPAKKTPVAAKRTPGPATRRSARPRAAGTVAAYDAPRARASGAAEERDNEVRAKLSYPCSEVDQERRGSGVMRVVAMEDAMAGLPEPGEGRVTYLVDTFERLLSLGGGGGGGGPMARNRDAARRRKDEGTSTATATASLPATPRGAEEIDVSYPSVASSSEVSFPVIPGVACILDASDRTSRISRARGQRRHRPYNTLFAHHRAPDRRIGPGVAAGR